MSFIGSDGKLWDYHDYVIRGYGTIRVHAKTHRKRAKQGERLPTRKALKESSKGSSSSGSTT